MSILKIVCMDLSNLGQSMNYITYNSEGFWPPGLGNMVDINDCYFQRMNTASDFGGVIQLIYHDMILRIISCQFFNCSSWKSGGCIYIYLNSHGTLTEKCTIESCFSESGHFLYSYNGTSITLNSSTMILNKINPNYCVYITSEDLFCSQLNFSRNKCFLNSYSAKSLNIKFTKFYSNHVSINCMIYISSFSIIDYSISNTEFINNTGTCIEISRVILTISDSIFKNNTSPIVILKQYAYSSFISGAVISIDNQIDNTNGFDCPVFYENPSTLFKWIFAILCMPNIISVIYSIYKDKKFPLLSFIISISVNLTMSYVVYFNMRKELSDYSQSNPLVFNYSDYSPGIAIIIILVTVFIILLAICIQLFILASMAVVIILSLKIFECKESIFCDPKFSIDTVLYAIISDYKSFEELRDTCEEYYDSPPVIRLKMSTRKPSTNVVYEKIPYLSWEEIGNHPIIPSSKISQFKFSIQCEFDDETMEIIEEKKGILMENNDLFEGKKVFVTEVSIPDFQTSFYSSEKTCFTSRFGKVLFFVFVFTGYSLCFETIWRSNYKESTHIFIKKISQSKNLKKSNKIEEINRCEGTL